MATFHENLVQSFTNFKNKFLKANGKEFHFAYDSTTQKYGYTIDGTFYPFRKVQASKTVTAGTSATTVTPDSGNDGIASVTVNPTPSQSKSATPSTSAQTITPDSGKLLSSVSVGAISTQTKTITSSTSAQTVTPDSGKYLTKVTVDAISTQEKTVTGSRSAQTVTPDSGKVLTKVTVNKYPDASGTYGTITTNGTHDMGATNNYRYVGVSVPSNIGGLVYNNHAQWTSTDNAGKTLSWTATQRCIVFGHITNTRFASTEISISVSNLNGLLDYTYQCPTRGGTNVYIREWIGFAVVPAGTTVSLTGTTYSFFDSGSSVYIQLCAYAL